MFFQASRRFFTAAILLCSPLPAFGQGLYWETTTTMQMAGDNKIESKSYYLPRMFKQGTEKEATVFRLDKQMIYTINYEKKEYSEMTFTELEAFVKKANVEVEGKMAELKKRLAEMPAEQRAAMEKMMGAQLGGEEGGGKIDVTKAAGTKTISGYSCSNYQLSEGGKEIGNIWTSTAVPDFGAMQNDFKEFSQRLASQMSMRGTEMAEAMKNVEGFPIQMTVPGMTATVGKIEKAAVNRSEFEVPAGFKKVEFTGPEGRGRRGRPDSPRDGGNH